MITKRWRSSAAGLLAAICAGGLVATAGSAPAQAQPEVWKLTSYVPVGSATWRDVFHQPFIDRVHLLTDEKIKIKGYSVGVLAGAFDSWKAVQKGTADMCLCFPPFITNVDPVNAIYGGIAGGMEGMAFQHWLREGGGEKLFQDFRRQEWGLQVFIIGGMGPSEIFLHSHKAVKSIDDLKGMKIRTTGAWASILKDLGASPTVLAPGDIYTSLERKVIDGTEWITPMSNIRMGLQKIARYIIIPGVHQPTTAQEIVVRASDYDKLPRDLQQKLEMATRLAGYDTDLYQGMEDIKAMEKMRQGRNTWIELPASARDRVTEIARRWSAEQAKRQAAKGNMWMQKVHDSYWAFFDRWNRYTDYRVKR